VGVGHRVDHRDRVSAGDLLVLACDGCVTRAAEDRAPRRVECADPRSVRLDVAEGGLTSVCAIRRRHRERSGRRRDIGHFLVGGPVEPDCGEVDRECRCAQ
jgi:hypothetical protein